MPPQHDEIRHLVNLVNPSSFNRSHTFYGRPSWSDLSAKIESLYQIPAEDAGVLYLNRVNIEMVLNSEEELVEYYHYHPPKLEYKNCHYLVIFTVVDMRLYRESVAEPKRNAEPSSTTSRSNDSSETDALVISSDPLHPANLIPELCKGFYQLGWVTGTGGGITIRVGDNVYIAPSGVQKERIKPTDIFVLPYPQPADSGPERVFLRRPTSVNLKESACTPLFWNAFDLRGASSCIHTHSQNAVMATLLWTGPTFSISHQMIKGVRSGGMGKALSYLDTLEIPIIENTPNEEDLKDSMAAAMVEYPHAAGVLVRRHGVYVWGQTWELAKTQTECLDYLFEIGVKMKLAGLTAAEVSLLQGEVVLISKE